MQRRSIANARQSQMRRVFPILPGDADGVYGGICSARERFQRLLRMNAGPQDSRVAGVRKPADAADTHWDGAGRSDARESALHVLKTIFRPLTDELRGDVQVVHAGPAQLRQLCCGTQAFEQNPQVVFHFVRDLNRREQAHGNLLVYAKCSSKAARVLYTVSLGSP